MTKRPTRETVAGRAYLELRQLACQQQRPTDELLQLYALEGFLARLAQSTHARQLILKGGVLMAAFGARRPTRDVDLSAQDLSNDETTISAVIHDILAETLSDGLDFDRSSLNTELIREENAYSGIRVTVSCRLASARLHFHVDVNVGDPIHPEPKAIELPRLLGEEPLVVTGYPIPMVLAEKIVTALQRGTANTRWRDFVDIAELARRHTVHEAELEQALRRVGQFRLVELRELAGPLTGYSDIAQPKWSAWRRKQRLERRTPEAFGDLLAETLAFSDPVLAGHARGQAWNPDAARWA